MGVQGSPGRRATAWNRRARCASALVVAVGLALSATSCKRAVAGADCDPATEALATDGTNMLECPAEGSQVPVWGVIRFNEQPVSPVRFLELLRIATGAPVDVERIAVIGDNVIHGVTSVSPSAPNPRPWGVDVTTSRPEGPPGGRSCNIVREPEVAGFIAPDGKVLALVRWTERVGNLEYSYCEEPRLERATVVDATGAPLTLTTVIA